MQVPDVLMLFKKEWQKGNVRVKEFSHTHRDILTSVMSVIAYIYAGVEAIIVNAIFDLPNTLRIFLC